MKINFDLKLSGSIKNTLEWMELIDMKKTKEKVKEYLLEQIDDNFETFCYNDGILDYNSDSLNFSFDFSENEKIILDNNVISDNIIIEDFTNRKKLPKNEKIYAITDEGLMDIDTALENDLEFDEYLIFKEKGEQKGRFIDSVIDYYKQNDEMAIVWVDMENMDCCFVYDLTEEDIQKIKKGNLGYFVYLEY